MERPILAITIGDPCGIGPEVCLKALNKSEIYDRCVPILVGSAKVLKQAAVFCGLQHLVIHAITIPSDAAGEYGTIDVIDQDYVNMDTFIHGKVSIQGGNAAYQAIKKAIELAMNGEVDGTVTAPLNKEALNLAGWHYSGHTEIYADLTGTKNYTMMLANGDFRVVHVSTHVSLRQACDRAKKDRELTCIVLADDVCRKLGIENPRIAVAGLNPHSGEHGLFGSEEIEEIIPAIEEAKAKGINVDGPIAPDTVFAKAASGQYDIVVAQYHDQGHIPMKLQGFKYDARENKMGSVSGVNITLGLPIIRSSVDHGTAFGKAGKGTANEESMVDAITYGILLASGGKKEKKSEAEGGE